MKQELVIQERIDAVAEDLLIRDEYRLDILPMDLANLLDLCPEQMAWMYVPASEDQFETNTRALFRLQASNGTSFHMSCVMNRVSEILFWEGPFDITAPPFYFPQSIQALAA